LVETWLKDDVVWQFISDLRECCKMITRQKIKLVFVFLFASVLLSGCNFLAKDKKINTKDQSVDYKNARSIPAIKMPAPSK